LAANYHAEYAAVDAEKLVGSKQEKDKLLSAKLNRAEELLVKAGILSPDALEVFVARADLAKARHNWAQAQEALEAGLKAHPKGVALYRALIVVEETQGHVDKALDVARQGLTVLPGEPELLLAEARLLLRKGQVVEAEKVANRLDKAKFSPFIRDLLKAQILVHKGSWGPAAQTLEGASTQLPPASGMIKSIDLMLAQCHERLGNPDLALVHYQEVLNRDRLSLPARVGAASALLSLGRWEDVVTTLRPVVGSKG